MHVYLLCVFINNLPRALGLAYIFQVSGTLPVNKTNGIIDQYYIIHLTAEIMIIIIT